MPDSANTGGRKPRVSDSDLLDVFRSTTDPVLSTGEVADAVPIKRRGVLNRLRSLEDAGELESKQIGGRNTVWWERRETGENGARADAGRDATETPPDTADGAHDTESDDLADGVRQYLESTDTPPKTEHGRSAVLDVFRYLREHGTTKTGELQDAVYPEYTDEWGSARTMWNALSRYLEDVPGIEKGGYGEWTYTGDGSVREELA